MRYALLCSFGFIALGLLTWAKADTCVAQYLPYGPGWTYGAWGAYPALNDTLTRNTIYQNQQENQRQSLERNAIRQQQQNQFFMNQAQQTARTQTARAESEDWILQHQPAVTSMAANYPPSYAPPGTQGEPMMGDPNAAPGTRWAAPSTPVPTPPQAANTQSSTTWPTLLMAAPFEAARTQVETVLAKAKNDGSKLTDADREHGLNAIMQMKGTLRAMASQLNAAEYLTVDRYLDDLATQIQKPNEIQPDRE